MSGEGESGSSVQIIVDDFATDVASVREDAT